MDSKNKAIVLLSGGLDSATTLALAQAKGFELYTLTFQYGQRHGIEVEAARVLSNQFQVSRHVSINIDLGLFGNSALTSEIKVPKQRTQEQMSTGIPITYVPARNTIFLSYALAFAEVTGAEHIFIGVNSVDYSGYPDCRPEYISSFEKMARLATKAGVEGRSLKIHSPLMDMSKAEIIKMGTAHGVDYSLTHSCYDPSQQGDACGECDSCLLRRSGFTEAGIEDPTRYSNGVME